MNNEIKINVPEGMEIDRENSTFECIKFKPKWIPKRGDIAANDCQIIIVEECQKKETIDFTIKGSVIFNKQSDALCLTMHGISLKVEREASNAEKEMLIKKLNEQGYVYDPNDPRVIYEKERELPKTWEEFCNNNKVKDGEVFIDKCSEIVESAPGYRYSTLDANILPSKEYAKAMLALCKLIQLRDCYNGDWKPDWKEDSFKYVIRFHNECMYKDKSMKYRNLLAFKTSELRDTFYNNFKDLIKEAQLLL